MTPRTPEAERTLGGIYGFASYLLWGLFPIYFLLLAPTGPWELIAWRVTLSFVVCLLILSVSRGWRSLVAIARQPRLLLWTGLAGLLIYVNWLVFIIGTLTERIVETSLGYFINPILTVLLAVVLLRERLRPLQWCAIALAAVAVVVIIIGYGAFPWVALVLAFSFGLYGLVKKKIGPSVDALSGLTLETAWIMPIAIVQLVLVASTAGLTMGQVNAGHTALLLLIGVVTTLPLLLFAAGMRRVPLSVIGLLQFLTPFMQFAIGVWVMGEPMPLERWIGFALVWVALTVLSVDMLAMVRRRRREPPAAQEESIIEKAWTGATSLPK